MNDGWQLRGRSAAIRTILADLERLMPSLGPARRVPPILLQGETGTGKGLLARTIHQASPRAAGPFIELNCAAIPGTLLEAELFGYEPGAFTDARQGRTGLMQAAHAGTLFLDEIGLLPADLQAKLLTVLEAREVRPLGGTRTRPVDMLIIAATNSDLREAVRERRFREDLYHRLAVLVFSLPPLRERGDDVLELADAFLARACADHAVDPKKLGKDARAALTGYPWPGNVRELANLMDRVALLTEGAVIAATDLELPTAPGVVEPGEAGSVGSPPLRASVDGFTRARLEEALAQARGNVSAAAEQLGVPRSTLRYQLERLGLVAAGGGRSKRPASRPPRPLAERVLTPPGLLDGERKQVTVLFADFRDAMERLTGGDPQDMRALLDPVLERMVEAIHRHGGTVSQVRSDGVMALFGAPLACEDHAVRACYAALAMHEAVGRYADLARTRGTDVAVRVGLHSGDVVLRWIGGEIRLDYAAAPQTTHVAAEMERRARPGSSLMTADTLRLAEGFVAVIPAAADFYELRGPSIVRSRLAAALTRGLVPFVGRDVETMQIYAAMRRTCDGHGEVVALVGEPGVGKSRLTWEVARSARAQGWLTLETGAVSAGKAPPYLPLADLLRGYFEIEPRLEPERIREKVTRTLVSLDESLRPLCVPLLAILNAPVDDDAWQRHGAEEQRRHMLDAARRLLLRASQAAPLMVVVDDLQWIDSETQACLDLLVESLPATKVLLLVNYRPEGEHGWSRKTYYTQVRVDPLPAPSAGELVDALVGTDPTLAAFKRLLVARTEGNPFFLEECVRTLVESGALAGDRGAYRAGQAAVPIRMPARVEAVLAARIDRLSPEDKRLLQVAAVVGKDVPVALLQAIAGVPDDALRIGLDHLQAAEFLYETGLFPDREYSFKHALTHEVAYASFLPPHRRELHRHAGEALERLNAEHPEDLAGRLAHHFAESGDPSKGLFYSARAAAKAASLFAHDEALVQYERARACAEALGLGEEAQAAEEAMGDVNLRRGRLEAAVEAYECALARAATPASRAAIKAKIGRVYGQFGSARGLEYLQEALAELDPGTQQNHIAEVTAALGRYEHYAGRHGRAIELLERARQLAEPLDDPDTVSGIYGSLAGAYQHLMRLEDSLTWARRCIAYGVQKHHLPAVTRGHMFVAQDNTWLGRWAEALTAAARQSELAGRIGALPCCMGGAREHRAAWAEHDRAVTLYHTGDLTAAAAAAVEALRLAEASGERRVAVLVHKTVSQSAADLGDEATAREHAHAAIAQADQLGDQVARALARAVLAYLHVQCEEWDQAATLGEEYARLLVGTDNRLARVMFGPTMAEAAHGARQVERAAEIIEASVALARETGAPHFEGVARRVEGGVLAGQGRWKDAATALDDAVRILQSLGSRLELGRALYHRGLGHHHQGLEAPAWTDLRNAGEIFASIGAQWDLARAEHALAKLNPRRGRG